MVELKIIPMKKSPAYWYLKVLRCHMPVTRILKDSRVQSIHPTKKNLRNLEEISHKPHDEEMLWRIFGKMG